MSVSIKRAFFLVSELHKIKMKSMAELAKKARRETGLIMTDKEATKLLHQPSMFLNRDGM